jgi:hypothetical protein
LFDQFISREINEGTDLVLNLAAGLEARPYRMDQGFLKTAARLGRTPQELLSLLPEPKGPLGNYLWTGVCLLKHG